MGFCFFLSRFSIWEWRCTLHRQLLNLVARLSLYHTNINLVVINYVATNFWQEVWFVYEQKTLQLLLFLTMIVSSSTFLLQTFLLISLSLWRHYYRCNLCKRRSDSYNSPLTQHVIVRPPLHILILWLLFRVFFILYSYKHYNEVLKPFTVLPQLFALFQWPGYHSLCLFQ